MLQIFIANTTQTKIPITLTHSWGIKGKGNGTDYMDTIEQQAKLTEKHEMIIKQQTTPAKDLVES